MPVRYRSSLISLCLLSWSSACNPPAGDGTGSSGGEPPRIDTLDFTGSSGEPTTGETTIDVPTTGDEQSGSASSGGVACEVDDDCADYEQCDLGVCAYDPNWCGEPVIPGVVASQVVLVLDKSGSMIYNSWDADADPATPVVTRWNSLHNVVAQIVDGFDAQMELGAVLFPSKQAKPNPDGACLMEDEPDVAVGVMQGAEILMSIPPADADGTQIAGGTPAVKGVKVATEHLAALPAGPQRYLVLVTDGAANCREDAMNTYEIAEIYDEALGPTVAAAREELEIRTFVVGVDIADYTTPVAQDGLPDATNTWERLNEVAVAGGMARAGDEKFYNATNELELAAALSSIAAQVSCEIALDPAPTEDQFPGVELGGQPVAEDPGCSSGAGWHFVDPATRDAIVLCEATCEAYREIADGLDIEYTCNTPG
jgi:hypothetical protein